MIGNTVMKVFEVIICYFDAEFYEVANWGNRLPLCNVLHMGVLVRRTLGIYSGRTELTVETLETLCSYSS